MASYITDLAKKIDVQIEYLFKLNNNSDKSKAYDTIIRVANEIIIIAKDKYKARKKFSILGAFSRHFTKLENDSIKLLTNEIRIEDDRIEEVLGENLRADVSSTARIILEKAEKIIKIANGLKEKL